MNRVILSPSRYAAVVAVALGAAVLPARALDLSAAWISRLPKIDYVWNSANPTVEGWPYDGETVTWVAHVRSIDASEPVEATYRWTMDGRTVDSGTVTIPVEDYATIDLPWKWERARHTLDFTIDPEDAISEDEERNNRIETFTDAITVGLYVEDAYWNRMREILPGLDIGCTTFDDWAQKRIGAFNEMAVLAKSPDAPEGVIDRWRIDEIVRLADGALPLIDPVEEGQTAPESAWATLFPNVADRTVDLIWGFPAEHAGFPIEDWYPMLYDSFIHELGHARYLIDVYASRVDTTWGDVFPFDAPVVNQTTYFTTTERGLMNQHYGFIDRYSAVAMNLIAHQRARRGNYNEPEDLGSFINDLPEQNRIHFVSPDGTPIANATVSIFQASGKDPDGLYPKIYDSIPDMTLRTDADGTVMVGRNPFSNGPVKLAVDESNIVAVAKVDHNGTTEFGFIESIRFNLAYWRGDTEMADHTVVVGAEPCSAGLRPSPTAPHGEALVTARDVPFTWSARFPSHQELWMSIDGGEPFLAATPTRNDRSVELYVPPGRIAWWIVADFGTCKGIRSDTIFFDHEIPTVPRRHGVRPPG